VEMRKPNLFGVRTIECAIALIFATADFFEFLDRDANH
ncbi:unnamed protein product, partial [Acidithrix sp. C25]